MKKITVVQINSEKQQLIPIEIEYQSYQDQMAKIKSLIGPKCTTLGMASMVGEESIFCDDDGWQNLDPQNQGVKGFKLDKCIIISGNAVCVGAEGGEHPYGGTFTFPLDKLRKFIRFGHYSMVDVYLMGR